MLPMKQLTVRALGWGSLTLALVQLPASAITSPDITQTARSATSQTSYTTSVLLNSPQLLAVGLTRRTLRPGDTGADVRSLQLYLGRNGLYPFEVDGVYGQETADGVATYQRIRDLPATGIADEETLRDMEFDFIPGGTTPVSPPPASDT